MICRADVPAEQCQLEPSWGAHLWNFLNLVSCLHDESCCHVISSLFPMSIRPPSFHCGTLENRRRKIKKLHMTWRHNMHLGAQLPSSELLQASWVYVPQLSHGNRDPSSCSTQVKRIQGVISTTQIQAITSPWVHNRPWEQTCTHTSSHYPSAEVCWQKVPPKPKR